MKRLIAWFAANSVAANLLMLLLLAGGLLTAPTIRQEVFPEFSTDRVVVSVAYPGATPEEIEQAINARIEERIAGLEGVKKITSTATEGAGTVVVETLAGFDTRELLSDIKSEVDAIDTFPEEAEEPVVRELIVRHHVISVAIYGDADERTLKHVAEQVRDEIAALPGITQVELSNARPYEVSIEVSEEALERYGLTFDEVVEAIRRTSLDLPGGSVKTRGGEILLRAEGQAYHGPDFERLTLLTAPDGARIQLGQVARVVDGFADTDQWALFDGKPAVLVGVFRVGNQSAIDVADAVKRYVRRKAPALPPGIHMTTWRDRTRVLRGRIETLRRNGLQGLVLVFLSLALFLQFRLAVWIAAGIPVAFLATLWLMPALGVSINVLSLFSFILVLGIVVDDAIVVGENVYKKKTEEGLSALEAVVGGTQQVAVPVIFGVLTTVAVFVPMLALPGTMGKIMRVFPSVVIPTLLFSLVESQLVLPAHLRHAITHLSADGPVSRSW
ncbi:MAG: efflux RND transporter permease subunit [Candidatus Dadabacteria bacterium]|nr:MAG: efflux RND transporter permease subunit [Candidatus Dadabacteria bacterium]